SGLAGAGSELFLQWVVMLSLLVGSIQLLMGICRFGALIQYVSPAVISGFISALAIIIIGHQLPALLGVARPAYNRFLAYMFDLLKVLPVFHSWTTAVGLTSILLLWIIKKMLHASPGPFIVLLMSIVVVDFFHLHHKGVAIV